VDPLSVELPSLSPPTANLGPPDVGETQTHCVFLPAAVDEAFHSLRNAAARAFGLGAPSIDPHLSLLYGDLGMSARRDIAQGLQLEPMEVSLSRIAVVRGGGAIQNWTVLRHIPLGP
jgi:hypothetical protein